MGNWKFKAGYHTNGSSLHINSPFLGMGIPLVVAGRDDDGDGSADYLGTTTFDVANIDGEMPINVFNNQWCVLVYSATTITAPKLLRITDYKRKGYNASDVADSSFTVDRFTVDTAGGSFVAGDKLYLFPMSLWGADPGEVVFQKQLTAITSDAAGTTIGTVTGRLWIDEISIDIKTKGTGAATALFLLTTDTLALNQEVLDLSGATLTYGGGGLDAGKRYTMKINHLWTTGKLLKIKTITVSLASIVYDITVKGRALTPGTTVA